MPWQTDFNFLNSTVNWNIMDTLTAAPNPYDNRDPATTGGGFGLLPWYLRAAAAPQAAAPPATDSSASATG